MAIIKKVTRRGFTLIELMIVVVIIGILASLAIYGVQKYVANSKSAEARMMLGRIAKDALNVFEGEEMAGTVMTIGASRGSSRKICAPSTNTVPAAATSVQGEKYQPGSQEWRTGDGDTGWACLSFAITTPIYYMYGYTSTTTTADPTAAAADTFTVTANGDLDGDTTLSTFTMGGTVFAQNNELQLNLSPSINETDPEE